MKTLRKIGVTLLIAGLMAPSGFAAATVSMDELFKSHSASIVQITLCGEYRDKGKSGMYRLVHAFLYGQSWLYLNRIGIQRPREIFRVEKTLVFKAINHSHADISLQNLRCKSGKQGVEITGKAWSAHTDKTTKVLIRIKPDLSSYRLKFY